MSAHRALEIAVQVASALAAAHDAGLVTSDCIAAILTAEPASLSSISPDVPAKLESILQKALRKNTDERYQTIKEMLAELRILKAKLETESSLSRTKAGGDSSGSEIKRPK